MIEPTGAELAARLRALLPTANQASYDGYLDLYAHNADGPKGPTISACGALSALTGPFRDCLEEGDFSTAGALLEEVERLLGEYPQPEPLDGSIANSVGACFLESVLPVPERAYEAIRPRLGPLIVSHAKRFNPWWLEPKPPIPPAQVVRDQVNLARWADPNVDKEVERLLDATANHVSRDIGKH